MTFRLPCARLDSVEQPQLQYNDHHGIPQSRGGSNHFINRQRIDVRRHDAHHFLFANCVPHEAVAQIVDQHRSVLQDSWVGKLTALLAYDPKDIYRKEAFKTEKHIDDLQGTTKGSLRRLLDEHPTAENHVPIFLLKFPGRPDYPTRSA